MIRIHRGPEPPELAKERHRRLAKLALEWICDEVDPTDLDAVARFIDERSAQVDHGYGVVREALRERLHRKCAYCERSLGRREPIDHHRPRRPLRRRDRRVVHPGYWWLTWSWSNLLFSCVDCNTHKGSDFEVEGPRCCPWSSDASAEQPRLLDPSRTDPREHLEFFLNSKHQWVVQGRTSLGTSTALALRLDSPSDRYDTHLGLLDDLVTDVRELAARDPHELPSLWRRKIHVFVARAEASFRMLTRAYLAHHLSDVIDAHGLELPSLHDDTPPATLDSLFPAIDGLDDDLVLRVLALGSRPASEETHAVLVGLVDARAWTLDELAAIMPQSKSVLRMHLQQLATLGKLSFDGDHVRPPTS